MMPAILFILIAVIYFWPGSTLWAYLNARQVLSERFGTHMKPVKCDFIWGRDYNDMGRTLPMGYAILKEGLYITWTGDNLFWPFKKWLPIVIPWQEITVSKDRLSTLLGEAAGYKMSIKAPSSVIMRCPVKVYSAIMPYLTQLVTES